MGVSSVIHYFNIKFAEKIGPKLYDKVAEHAYAGASLIGELIFSHIGIKRLLRKKEHLRSILFDIFEKRYDEWSTKNVKESLEEIVHIQEFVSSFIEECRIEVLGDIQN